MSELWPYATPGIPDRLFQQLPGIPLTKREVRLLVIGYLRLKPDAYLWDIGAGTGTIAIEAALLCPKGTMTAVERDEEVAKLIKTNCDRFDITNIEVISGSAPECLHHIEDQPSCILIEGAPLQTTLETAWQKLALDGRIVVTANNLEALYTTSETFAKLQVRNIEVAQPAVNRLETRGNRQVFAALDPIFIISGDKLE
ncbi:precorrin-6Y C5,15-methyltransferase subunit CbiT [cf. Phormidesmis sp. LEGE 11477]|uniref:precorrin-6Y C5,15-methyltransferase subunit CbiT n=1 Tax=cf. Phormidesmis sp. LEGE 11477 TaxID=1828680 RepID=UPI00187F9726|nr:precorrin-6Y C5,15-methyltransferase subunit CbiT [cf. Phormidesmis sp. LEGE 11477]MBE9064812.1 precorrin-6Y C5,15-methyltransferase subunit CbiT [cf. Phormidesmis sp. LEGE 11477]